MHVKIYNALCGEIFTAEWSEKKRDRERARQKKKSVGWVFGWSDVNSK
jgi:hypothetical protein